MSVVSVESTVRSRVRAAFLRLHQLVGLTLGLLLLVEGVSGSVLVWRPALDRLLLPSLTHSANAGPRVSLDAELAAVRAAMPDAQVRMARLSDAPDGADEWAVVRAAGGTQAGARRDADPQGARHTVYVAPATAQVLGVRGGRTDALGFLVDLHHSLLMGRAGRTLLGIVAIAAILLAASGLWLWWPRRWMPSRFRPCAAARPLHYALGFWAMWPLLVIAVSALYFVWRQPIQKAFGVDAPRPESAERGRPPRQHADAGRHGPPELSLDAALQAARAALPSERVAGLRLPEGASHAITVLAERPGEHHRSIPDQVTVSAAPGGAPHVDRVLRWDQMPLRKRLLEWLPRVHQAEFGGLPVRLLWTATGWTPVVLYWSGFLMWRRRLKATS